MKTATHELIDTFKNDNPDLSPLFDSLLAAATRLAGICVRGGTVLICGNGGSSADSDHIVGELMKSFTRPRPVSELTIDLLEKRYGEEGVSIGRSLQMGLPSINLNAHNSLVSAISNDIGSDMVFAQQVWGYGKADDALIALSTSGNSKNIVNAVKVARIKDMYTLALTGEEGGLLAEYSEACLRVPAAETYRVQEYHLPIYHFLCAYIETEHF